MKPINRASLAILAIMGLFCCRSISGAAQTIEITSFKDVPEDLTAVSHGTSVLDQNGEKCALIKVETTQTGFSFDPGALGVVKTDYKPGEIWVYVPHGVKKITISHPTFGVLRDYDFPHALQRAHTYLLTLHVEKGEVAFQAETSFVDKNLSRTTLFTLEENEVVYYNEHFMVLNVDRTRFACVSKDTVTGEMTYVWNGVRKIKANNLFVCYNDLYDYDKCILMYSDSIRFYQTLKIEDKLYGPYDKIYYIGEWGRGINQEYNRGWAYKNVFGFRTMGTDIS